MTSASHSLREPDARSVLEDRRQRLRRQAEEAVVHARMLGAPWDPGAEAAWSEWTECERELERLRRQRIWWCRQCGVRFRRRRVAQARCDTCLGWLREVHCRGCGRRFTITHPKTRYCAQCREPEHRAVRARFRICTLGEPLPDFFCAGCGQTLEDPKALTCPRCTED
jgi:hypothetical protein